jgi:hypothetical protein
MHKFLILIFQKNFNKTFWDSPTNPGLKNRKTKQKSKFFTVSRKKKLFLNFKGNYFFIVAFLSESHFKQKTSNL